ncbi:transcription factor mef2A-like isoform X2 [Phymastichus coffea]|nr:transcription factor mef2A-like isoform X2 [Phymastichus coffea]XP_058805321.1 transcription factor mef2A-like isoform X2 [Phymastichus coffea]
MAAPKFGTLVPNRIFVGGISASTSEAELAQLFSNYGNVKATKIIADRGGVSKGYGFVTFETEEEAKRLQQESECIVLKERKLNIAPAIKKQPFNRSFDGGTGSPPAVPTNPYYYANGMALPYQNGVTFYNTGAPAPGAAIAPPTDPTALYQAAGVFGPQAATSHQTYGPMMYPVPAPSIYMPQQYPYSPMPYEPYFPGTTAAGAPPFLYSTNGGTTSNGTGGSSTSGSGGGGANSGATSAASPVSGHSPPQFQTHYYGPSTTHHPLGAMAAGAPHPPPQMEHIYYSYQPQPHHAGPLTLPGDQQLLVYATEIGQPPANESQVCQEDTRSTSSHTEQLQQQQQHQQQQHQQHQQQQQQQQTATASDSGGGGSNATSPPSTVEPTAPKYPNPRYTNPTLSSTIIPALVGNVLQGDDSEQQQPPMQQQQHYPVSIYPTPLYIPHRGGGASLLPTPPSKPLPYGHKPPLVQQSAYVGRSAFQATKYPRVSTPPARLSQYNKRGTPMTASANTCYFQQKATCPRSVSQQQFVYGAYTMPFQKPGYAYEYANGVHSKPSTRGRHVNVNSYRGPNLTMSADHQQPQQPQQQQPNDTASEPSPIPNHSPSPNPTQVQFFGPPAQRVSSAQPQQSQRRYPTSSSSMRGKPPMRGQQQQTSKYKINGLVSGGGATGGKIPVNEASLGGAGDAPPMLPITPPTTPQGGSSGSSSTEQQVNESCHQIQALSL